VKKIKAALLSKLKVMENQIHLTTEQEVTEWLLGIVNSKEEYESLISDLSRITGLTKEQIIEKEVRENEN
jgi:osmotically-inducible protein OsmY